MTSARLPQDLLDQVAALAEARQTTRSEVVRAALASYLDVVMAEGTGVPEGLMYPHATMLETEDELVLDLVQEGPEQGISGTVHDGRI